MSIPSRRRIRKFNPGTFQSDAEVTDQFVVRRDALDAVLMLVGGGTPDSPPPSPPTPPHILVTGRRGFGKTMLLARVAAQLRTNDSERLLPVRLMEENYEIFTVADFWLEVLSHLAHELAARDPSRADTLVRIHADLATNWQDVNVAARAAEAVRYAVGDLTLVVMLENLQDLCATADPEFERGLHDTLLQHNSHLRLLATAINPFADLSSDVDGRPREDRPWALTQSPLYKLFTVVRLKPLDEDSSRRLWTSVSHTAAPPEAIRPLHILTGGNPRLLVMIAGLARERSLHGLIEELVTLIDDHTDYFREQLDGLAKTERRVYIAVVALWQPSTSRDISERARVDARTVSAMLARLVSRGLVVATRGTRRPTYYHAAEGFLFNVYYNLRRDHDATSLLRAGSRSAPAGAGDMLVRFMAAFYAEAKEADVRDALLADAEAQQPPSRVVGPPSETRAVRPSPLPILDPRPGPSWTSAQQVVEAKELLSQARQARLEGRGGDAERRLNAIIERYEDSRDAGVLAQVGEALEAKAALQSKRGLERQELGSLRRVVEVLKDRPEPEVVEQVNRVLERMWARAGRWLKQGEIRWPNDMVWVTDEVRRRCDIGVMPPEYRIEAWSCSHMAQASMGDYEGARESCDAVLEDLKKYEGQRAGEITVWTELRKGIYEARLGRLENAITLWKKVREVAGEETATGRRATGLICMAQFAAGRVTEAWGTFEGSTFAATEWVTTGGGKSDGVETGAGKFWFMVQVLWARLRRNVEDGREARRRVATAVREFRATYGQLEPDKEEMIRVVLPPVIELVALGASERDLVAILMADNKKAAALWPVVVALQQRAGMAGVPPPSEVMAVAKDVGRRMDKGVRRRMGTAADGPRGGTRAMTDVGPDVGTARGRRDDEGAVAWYRRAARQGSVEGQYNLGWMYSQGHRVRRDDEEGVRWFRRAADQGNAMAESALGVLYSQGRGVERDDEEAVRWYRLAADQGNAMAANNLGVLYEQGRGVERDDEEAVRWYRLAADQGNAMAANNLGWMYEQGRGVERDDEEAVRWYRLAADQGYAMAANNLGWMYKQGRGVERDDEEAVRWYRLAADQGYAMAANNLGGMYEQGRGVERDDEEAVRWYRLAADQGYAMAESALGVLYSQGRGVERDDEEAVRWYRLAADQGYAMAESNLGWMYSQGRGVERDDEEAVRWYRLAANQGYAMAESALGVLYSQGRGVERDDEEAVRWYRLAADQGYAMAESNLGVLYKQGRGVERDDEEAVRWYRLAADQGYAMAANNLGVLYEQGRGVERDDEEAVRWYRLAADQGNAMAANNLGVLYEQGRGVERDDEEAVRWFRLAADHGYAEGQYNLGVMYGQGRGVERDDEEAVRWFRLAADQGDAMAANNLGGMYEHGRGVERDDEEAVRWFRRAADQGYAMAANNLGWMYEHGRGVERDDEEAVRWFRLAADQGNAEGQYNLGWMYEQGRGVERDDEEAVRWYRLAADQGNAMAENNLGVLYEQGRGVERDDEEAVRWFRLAADHGYAEGQYNLGAMYGQGRGVERDDEEAVRWFRLAADQGDAMAANNLGGMYEHGRGVERDDEEAVRWFRRAADQGNAMAANNLGWMYEHGRGVERDDEEAVRWFRLAADQGNAEGQYNLGWMYEQGSGVERDDEEAVRWYRLAADHGYADAQRRLDGLR